MKEFVNTIGADNLFYIIFGTVLFLALSLDLGILSRNAKKTSTKSALIQTACWVALAMGFGWLMYIYEGGVVASQFVSGYLMEFSLSTDNVFVFIIILQYFKVPDMYYPKVLFWGILMAVVLRVIFIFVGIVLVDNFHWILYFFGAILIYSGWTMLMQKEEAGFEPEKNIFYKLLNKRLRFTKDFGNGNLIVREENKRRFTLLFLVIAIIGGTDLLFALDSIPAVFAISQNKLVVLTSNIFAVMGLRAMFFLLSGIYNKFSYLQEGISFVLMFIGAKMLLEIFGIKLEEYGTQISLAIIVLILASSILLSLLVPKKTNKE